MIKEKKKEEDKRHQRYSYGPSKLNENILARNLPSEMELKLNLGACREDWL